VTTLTAGNDTAADSIGKGRGCNAMASASINEDEDEDEDGEEQREDEDAEGDEEEDEGTVDEDDVEEVVVPVNDREMDSPEESQHVKESGALFESTPVLRDGNGCMNLRKTTTKTTRTTFKATRSHTHI
jgi:hypothetical protein